MAANTNGRSPLARALCGSLGLFGACSVSFRGNPSGKQRTAAFTAQVYRHLVYRRAVGEGRAGPEISDARANRGLRHCLRFSHSGKQRTAAFTVNFTAKVYRHLVYRRAVGEGRAGPEISAARTNRGSACVFSSAVKDDCREWPWLDAPKFLLGTTRPFGPLDAGTGSAAGPCAAFTRTARPRTSGPWTSRTETAWANASRTAASGEGPTLARSAWAAPAGASVLTNEIINEGA